MKNAARCLSDIRATTRETTKRLITILLLPGDLEGKTVSLSVVSLKKISGFFVNKIPVSCSMYDVPSIYNENKKWKKIYGNEETFI